ncbi:MAG TPA: hypothetical protein VKQ36_16325 [Ktedonobacterales bacterium]|nr:hypothetical protein [Ktedonobacterales bacterium]
MSGRLKVNACLIAVLAVVFDQFWQLAKHQPALAQVNPFADDPYDAVGSFGVLLASFTALLSVIRAFRPYQSGEATGSQQLLLARGEYMTCLAVAVTLAADVVAILRFHSLWLDAPAGYALAALVGGMALFTAVMEWAIHHVAPAGQALSAQSARHGWIRWLSAFGISVVGALILAVYPESLTQIEGWELLTVVVGALILFATVWAWAMVISPSLEMPREDFLDDLTALYQWFKAHIGFFSVLLLPLEKALGSRLLHPLVNVLNPRHYPYSIPLVGLLIGACLALTEAIGDPGPASNLIHRFAIFAGLGCAGFLLGYAFLATPLALFRRDSREQR